jgi:hypothetical protein
MHIVATYDGAALLRTKSDKQVGRDDKHQKFLASGKISFDHRDVLSSTNPRDSGELI